MREELDLPYKTIAGEIGGRDHTTVMHNYSKIKKLIIEDSEIEGDIIKIKDSYTGETLGNVETKVGLVEIVDSNSKFSVAKIIELNLDLESNFKPRKYMIKPFKSAKKLKQNQAKEKIEKKKK